MIHQQKWYVVTVGTEPGVYSSWIEAGPKTRNIPGGSIHQSFPTYDEAIRMFEAAKSRGEVKAYPDVDKEERSTSKSKNAAPLSPLGVEAALLRTPPDLERDAESEGLQTAFSSTTQWRVAKLRRTLKDSTDSFSTSSSPPTGVTQVHVPLYEEDDSPPDSPEGRPLPHFSFTSSSSRAYPTLFSETGPEEMPLQLEGSDWSSPPATSSSLDSHPSAEEHTSKPPRCMPPHPEFPRSKGVEYRSLADLVDAESIDSRIWLPKSRVFDPAKIKSRPATRPSSPAKSGASFVPGHETVDSSPQLRSQISLVDSPFVRADRGRYSRLTPSSSLPTLPDREPQHSCSDFESRLTQLPESYFTGKGKQREIDYSVHDIAKRPTGYGLSLRNDGRSHVQLVPRDGRDEQSAIMVHCPPTCPHETCYHPPLALSVSKIEPCRPAVSRYADACVSPIITITGRIQGTYSPFKIRPKGPDLDGDHPCGLIGFTHVSHKGLAGEADIRSPIVKGTMIPTDAAETPFGRPSPQVRVSQMQMNKWSA